MNPKVIIFAQPRTGSNTLADILDVHSSINLMREPFNERRDQWKEGNINYLQEMENGVSINHIMEEIAKEYTGFKTLSYQLSEEKNEQILTQYGYQVILLYRKNQLQSAVSAEIAKQTHVWQAEDKNKNEHVHDLRPLNIEKIREAIESQHKEIARYRDVLENSKTEFIEITYEDLFEVSDSEKLAHVAEIFDFLNLKMIDKEEVKKLMDVSRKITSDDIYKTIPNLADIEKLGNEETGYLFKNN